MICKRIKHKKYKFEIVTSHYEHVGIFYQEIDHKFFRLDKNGFLTIKNGYQYDGASGWFTVQTDAIVRAAAFHDALYQMMRDGLLDKKYRKQADVLFHRLCLKYGMSKFRAWYCYKAVRTFGRFAI